ncbi:MAG: hypothetical protein F6K58_26325 [Symploca sp. SIO2E9]|nr:hypothetical protein [Symploca sp. SIO2E9]
MNDKPWAVARLISPSQWIIIGRYRSRSDAERHLKLMHQTVSKIQFEVVFDLPNNSSIDQILTNSIQSRQN